MVFSSGYTRTIIMAHSNEVNPTHSTSQSHALFGVTLPCPGKCWACKTELSIIQHEQEDVWSDTGGGQGPTKPRADRGYYFDASVWACRVEQGALGNLQEQPPPNPLPRLQPTTPSFFSLLPPGAEPLCTLYVLLRFPLWHTLPLSASSLIHTYRSNHHTRTVHANVRTHTRGNTEARLLCPLTKQEQAALVTDNKAVNGWFWRNSVVAVSHEWHYSFIQWILKVPLSRASFRSHTIASLITLSSEKKEVNGWHFATPWVLLPITIETQIRPN